MPRRLLLLALMLAGCPAPAPAPSKPPADFDVCAGSPPAPHGFSGLLRNTRCDQHLYQSMGIVATQLNVECNYCHVLKPHPEKPFDFDYPVMTPKKEIANWMSLHLMQAVKPADGSEMHCKSCHTDDKGNPVAKILGDPRDPEKAFEWMSLTLVRKFVAASDGSKLKCTSCHVGGAGSPQFEKKVILRSGQLPAHTEGTRGTPSL